jgi:DNA-directed RNA polymerase subunit RPC12/RpoP
VRLRCPECNAKALVRFQERAALPPLFATYGCRKCGTSCVKVFRW